MKFIDNIQLILTCKDDIRLDRIPFELINNSNLNQIKIFFARGINGTREPFISIPSNICLLSEMYGTCLEVQYWLDNNNVSYVYLSFTVSLYTIDFGNNTN
jgi:hypothetical protein